LYGAAITRSDRSRMRQCTARGVASSKWAYIVATRDDSIYSTQLTQKIRNNKTNIHNQIARRLDRSRSAQTLSCQLGALSGPTLTGGQAAGRPGGELRTVPDDTIPPLDQYSFITLTWPKTDQSTQTRVPLTDGDERMESTVASSRSGDHVELLHGDNSSGIGSYTRSFSAVNSYNCFGHGQASCRQFSMRPRNGDHCTTLRRRCLHALRLKRAVLILWSPVRINGMLLYLSLQIEFGRISTSFRLFYTQFNSLSRQLYLRPITYVVRYEITE